MKRYKLYIIVSIILILIIIGLFYIKNNKEKASDPIGELVDEIPVAPVGISNNEKIRFLLTSFRDIAKKNKEDFKNVCDGGFINTDKRAFEKISDEIIKNRIINFHPLEYALTQDEAGITCLSDKDRWVLFTALNEDEEDNYFCVDSGGRKGSLALDRVNLKCGY